VPTYEYRCAECGHTFEVVQRFSDPPVTTCERCHGPVEKVLQPVAIHFRGSGFYTTDYKRSPAATRPSGGDDSSGKKPGGGESSAATDSGEPAKGAETKAKKESG